MAKRILKRFTDDDDAKLTKLVQELGPRQWIAIAEQMGNKTSQQCKLRWTQYIDPKINQTKWKKEEDDLLIYLEEQYGKKWSKLSKYFNGRTRYQLRKRMAIS